MRNYNESENYIDEMNKHKKPFILFKWIYKPCGKSPVESEGYFLGYYFYFRSKWDFSEIEFAKTKEDWEDTSNENIVHFYVKKYKTEYAGGWIKKRYAKHLIYKGCLLFLLYKLGIKKHQH